MAYYAMADQRVIGPEPNVMALDYAAPSPMVDRSSRKHLHGSNVLPGSNPRPPCMHEKPSHRDSP